MNRIEILKDLSNIIPTPNPYLHLDELRSYLIGSSFISIKVMKF